MAVSPSDYGLLLGADLRRIPQHDQAARAADHRAEAHFLDLVATFGGMTFDSGSAGCYGLFARLEQGLAAAVAIQRACLADQTPIPMAIHSGPLVRCGQTYTGPPLQRLRSILEAGHAGQILLSRSAQELIDAALPAGLEIRQLGLYRLQDLVRPAQLFQVCAPDLPGDFPPLHTIDRYQHNLPIQPAPFIGREAEIAAICDLLLQEDVKLVSLIAPSGTGKSRLSLQVAAKLLERFEHGIYFIGLAAIEDARLVPSIIAHRLGLKEARNQDVLETLATYLRERRMLLVLDNFEQLLPATPALSAILQSCPQLKMLVTSQKRLNSAEERCFVVRPLALPDPAQLTALEDLVRYPAIALFLERAQIVQPAFRLTPKNVAAIAELCHTLDGLPLAIELVAAHSKAFLPQDMLLFVRTRMLLDKAWRKGTGPHAILQTVLDWSHELLHSPEKILFARLGVFVGGGTIEAAEAVCNANDDLTIDILDTISLLLDKNLLLQELLQEETTAGEPRFIMLDHIHEYALERLNKLGELAVLRDRHAQYYLALAEEAEPELRGTQQEAWLRRIEGEHDNLRAALTWSFSQADPQIAVRMCGALWRFWWLHGYLAEGGRWLTIARECSADQPAPILARVYHGSGIIAWLQGHYDQAQSFFQRCLELRQATDDQAGSAIIYNNLGHLAMIRNAAAEATGFLEQALVIQRTLNDDWGCAYSILNLGNVAWRQRDYLQAARLYHESLQLRRKINDLRGVAATLGNLAWVALHHADSQQAHSYFVEALNIAQAQGNSVGVAEILLGLAAVAALRDQPLRMARLAGASEALGELLRAKLWPDIGLAHEQVLRSVSLQAQKPDFAAALAEGRAMLVDQAVAYALSQLAGVEAEAPAAHALALSG